MAEQWPEAKNAAARSGDELWSDRYAMSRAARATAAARARQIDVQDRRRSASLRGIGINPPENKKAPPDFA